MLAFLRATRRIAPYVAVLHFYTSTAYAASDLMVSVAASSPAAVQGDIVNYDVVVTNNGPDPAGAVVLELGRDTSLIDIVDFGGLVCTPTAPGTTECALPGQIPPGGNAFATFVGNVVDDVCGPATLDVATSFDGDDPIANNDADAALVTLTNLANMCPTCNITGPATATVGDLCSFEASAAGAGGPPFTFAWSQPQGTRPGIPTGNENNTTVAISIDAATLGEQPEYSVTMRCTSFLGHTSVAKTEVVLTGGAIPGTCIYASPSYTAVEPFSLSCTGWTDAPAELPLSYRFSLVRGDGSVVPLGTAGAAETYEGYVPAGADTTPEMTILVEVINQSGKVSAAKVSVPIVQIDADDPATTTLLDGLLTEVDDLVLQGKSDDAAALVSVVAGVLNEATDDSEDAIGARTPVRAALLADLLAIRDLIGGVELATQIAQAAASTADVAGAADELRPRDVETAQALIAGLAAQLAADAGAAPVGALDTTTRAIADSFVAATQPTTRPHPNASCGGSEVPEAEPLQAATRDAVEGLHRILMATLPNGQTRTFAGGALAGSFTRVDAADLTDFYDVPFTMPSGASVTIPEAAWLEIQATHPRPSYGVSVVASSTNPYSSDTETTGEILSVEIFDELGAKLAVDGLATPIVFAYVLDPHDPDLTHTCSYYDELGHFDQTGCTKEEETASTVVCACNHLTSFSVMLGQGGGTGGDPCDESLWIWLNIAALGSAVIAIILLILFQSINYRSYYGKGIPKTLKRRSQKKSTATTESVFAAPANDKLKKKRAKVKSAEQKKLTVRPSMGYSSPIASMDAGEQSHRELLTLLYGRDLAVLDSVLDAGGDDAKCAVAVHKAATKYAATLDKEGLKLLQSEIKAGMIPASSNDLVDWMARAIDDPDGKLATAREKLQKAVETKCATADFETALPGLCPGGACIDPPATTGRAVQGLVCNWTGYTNRAMRLSADADLVLGAGGPVPNDVYCWSRGN